MNKNIVFRIEQTRSKEVWYFTPEQMKNCVDLWVEAKNWGEQHTPENFIITLQSTDIKE